MAGPISHIAYALLMINNQGFNVDQEAFTVGTSFPDIRHISHVHRTRTHVPQPTWLKALQSPSSFQAGLLFHNLIDQAREDYLRKSGIYTRLKKQPYLLSMMKLYEDQIIYEKVSNWPKIRSYFDQILNPELGFTISRSILRKWHTFIQFCIDNTKDRPEEIIKLFYRDPQKVKDALAVFEQVKKSNLKVIILEFYANLPEILQSYYERPTNKTMKTYSFNIKLLH